jgi:guanylate kinase
VAISATTRRPRPGEIDGEHYHFLTPEQFTRMVDEGAFLEHVTYAGNRYGTLRSEIDRILAAGRCPIVEIELAGARAVRDTVPEAVSVFISPPSLEELVARLSSHGTDTPGEIAARMETSRVELAARDEFDHTVINADKQVAIEDLAAVITVAVAGADA